MIEESVMFIMEFFLKYVQYLIIIDLYVLPMIVNLMINRKVDLYNIINCVMR